jgi:HEAT repeat protein
VTVAVEQAKWAVLLRSREHPQRDVPDVDDERIRWTEVDVDAALRGFSGDIGLADEDAKLRAIDALSWLRDQRAVSPLLRRASRSVRRGSALGRSRAGRGWSASGVGRRVDCGRLER